MLRKVAWGWGSVADFASWMAGIGIAIWRIYLTGTIDPAVLTFVGGLMTFPLIRRGVESRVGK